MSVQNPGLLAAVFNTVTEDPELSSSDRLVLLAIVSHCQTQGQTVYPSIRGRLDKMTGLTRRTIGNVLYGREDKPGLIERGYLSIADRGVDPQSQRHRPNAFALGPQLLGIAEPADPMVGLECATIAHSAQPLPTEDDQCATIAPEVVETPRRMSKGINTPSNNVNTIRAQPLRTNGHKTIRPGEDKLAFALRT